MHEHGQPVGVVLAGGLGRRIGGSKAVVHLAGRPLISYPLEAVWRAVGNVAVVAKIDTELPSLPGVAVWVEPNEPRHPLTGIVHALGMAEARPVLVCAADMPLLGPGLLGEITRADPGGRPAVVASARGELQPLLGCYRPAALPLLAEAVTRSPARALRETITAIGPAVYEVEDTDQLFNVNTPDDLLQASAMLGSRRGVAARPPTRT
jgi:molybdopterin-guanine dinucleotide biosynthesis protein A